MCYYDGTDFHLWVPRPNGLLQPLATAGPVEGEYLAAAPAHVDDVHLAFFEWALKHIYTNKTRSFIDGIRCDLLNLCASMAKIDFFFAHQSDPLSKSLDSSRFALTELEYIMIACRSLFDLLQELVQRIWDEVTLNDKTVKKKTLADSFAKMTLSSEIPRSAEDLKKTYGLPDPLADFYESSADFFLMLRKARDAIVHSPSREPYIYRLEKGYAVNVTQSPFNSIDWPENELAPNKLGSLRKWIAYCVNGTLLVCERFCAAVSACLQFPADFAPNHRVFLRGYHTVALHQLRVLLSQNAWSPFVPGFSQDSRGREYNAVAGSDVPYLPSHQEIAEAAYFRWLNRQNADGNAEKDWLEAERSLSARLPMIG